MCNTIMSSGKNCEILPIIRDGKCIFHIEDKTEEECIMFKNEFPSYMNTDYHDDFTRFVFPKEFTLFNDIHFKKKVCFNNAKFYGVWFYSTTFDDYVSFNGAEFFGHANFSNSTFNGDVYFDYSKFRNSVLFDKTKFNKKASFDRSIFKSLKTNEETFNASFIEAEFNHVSFSDTNFETTDANFLHAKFNDKTIFYMTTFNQKVRFSNVNFFGETLFTSVKFGINSTIAMFDKITFHNKCEFNDIDLSNTCFLNSNVSEVEFFNVTWKKENNRNITIAEKFAEIGVGYTAVSQLYSRLRMSYEKKYMFVEAGDFFIGEMEMRRKNVTTNNKRLRQITLWYKMNFCFLGIYKHLNDYGENYRRPIFFGTVLILSYPILIYLYFNDIYKDSLINNVYNLYPSDLRDSIASFFQIGSRYVIERILSVPILGSFYIALKRKFERNR